MAFDYETICYRLGLTEWPNLKERIDEPEIQDGFKSCADVIDNFIEKFDTFQTTGTDEDEEACFHAEWCGDAVILQFSILVDAGKVQHPPLKPYAERLRKKKYEKKIRDIKPFERELPDDVLVLIRQYAKPAFIHFREYKQALDLFHLPFSYKQKLKEKMGDPAVREQLKICIDAHLEWKNAYNLYLANKTQQAYDLSQVSEWRKSISLDKLYALLDEREYYMKNFAEWTFQDEIDDAWMDDSDEEPMTEEEHRLACLRQEEDLRQEEEYDL